MSKPGSMTALVWLLVAAAPALAAEAPTPAPISPAERAAVSLVLAYFEQGPGAVREALSPTSEWAALGPSEANAEIETRLGPAEGARWQLQRTSPALGETAVVFSVTFPSGLDETVIFELAKDNLAVERIRVLAERGAAREGDTSLDRIAAAPIGGAGPFAAAALLLGVAAVAVRRPRRLGVAVSCLLMVSCGGGAEGGIERLGSLLPVRAALAAGVADADLEALFAAVPAKGDAREVADLWRADALLRRYRLNDARAVLEPLPDPSDRPQAELLRARLAVLEADDEAILGRYEAVRALGVDHDGLRVEAAEALGYRGLEAESDQAFSRAAWMGSRIAAVHYRMAEAAILEEDLADDALESFRTGWTLEPLDRGTLFRQPLLATVCTHERILPLLDLTSPVEPAVGRAEAEREPLPFPSNAELWLVGDHLRVDRGDRRLSIPGGGVLAPPETRVVSPAEAAAAERSEALEDLPTLLERATSPAAFASTTFRRSAELAALALFEAERVDDLLALTEALSPSSEDLPPLLVQLRAWALRESERDDDGLALLVALAKTAKEHRRQDAGVLHQLADVLVARGEYDLAQRLLQKAGRSDPSGRSEVRLAQVKLEHDLVGSSRTYETRHFRLRYPASTGEEYPRDLGTVLEEELRRLQRWIPLSAAEPIDVDLYPVMDFLRSYSQSAPVVGLYDGRVRVPFADLRSLAPDLVSILSHEVAHAMLDQATDGGAPRWFHEGLAQHVEMVQRTMNPVPDLESRSGVLSLAVVEQALEGSSEPQFVELSYSQAAWTLHYLEAKHGVRSIHRLIAAFAGGATTEGALEAAVGMGIAELDGKFRAWGAKGAPKLWPTNLRRYDREADRLRVVANEPREAAPRVTNPNSLRSLMNTWYASYRQTVAPAKAAIAPVISALRGSGASPTLVADCRAAEGQLRRLLAGNGLKSPDDSVTYHLTRAFEKLKQTAGECRAGQVSVAQALLGQAEAALGAAASRMGKYGMAP